MHIGIRPAIENPARAGLRVMQRKSCSDELSGRSETSPGLMAVEP
ncbi:hypothetical protein Hoch_2454 [Haliangium ochraceum DSM 14365]|uniref:Uncharacterized protein n=1 Tax=Haliangium ochraceum (strain DSM 14365 / JCM 11303 / SMP-2) TaxID=502025 RepID=D0LKE2_HALO1|nr:hypothetical protein Hoch_2454 [Haliangium ochraceum DSM 14365]